MEEFGVNGRINAWHDMPDGVYEYKLRFVVRVGDERREVPISECGFDAARDSAWHIYNMLRARRKHAHPT